MPRLKITAAAYDAIVAALTPMPKIEGLTPQFNDNGERWILVDLNWLAAIRDIRKGGEAYSDVIVRMARLISEDNSFFLMANAKRLQRDAIYLSEHGRYPSAFALALLGLEEIGKMVLRLWRQPDDVNHLNKQRAVASLLLGQFLVEQFGEELSATKLAPELLDRAAKVSFDSEEGRFLRMVNLTAVDKAKQAALYSDILGIHPDVFGSGDVESLIEKSRMAILAAHDRRAMAIGEEWFNLARAADRKRRKQPTAP
jgi:AbiV family abortive infection protein